jgi:guanylate kinase
MRGHIVTLTGQSGTGKTTIAKSLQRMYPEEFTEVISHTTRQPRKDEKEGVEYYFINEQQFEQMEANKEFLETVLFSDRRYGAAYAEADMRIASGRNAFMIVEPDGVRQWKENYDGPMLHISIQAPNIDALIARMRRQGRTEKQIQKRLAHDAPVFNVDPACYHLVVVNDRLEQACNDVRNFVLSRSSSP